MTEVRKPEAWAPDPLKELYGKRLKTVPADRFGNELLVRLLTYPQMRLGWGEIAKQQKHSNPPYESPYLEVFLFYEIRELLIESAREHVTRNDKSVDYKDIAKHARKFAKIVCGTEVDTAVHRYFPPEILAMHIAKAAPDLSKRLFESGNILYPGWKDQSRTLLGYYDNLFLNYYHPSITHILENLAEKAEEIATEALSDGTMLPRPRYEHAQRLFFMRGLAQIFNDWFGKLLHRTIAAFTEAALDEKEIDRKLVKDALKHWTPSPADRGSFRI